jgi:sugar phosphate isomerase/epimerase
MNHMLTASSFAVNTYDKSSLATAKKHGFALEVEAYLWTYHADEIFEKHKQVTELIRGFAKTSFHGTAVSREVDHFQSLPAAELFALYNESYGYASFHTISKIIFHSNYSKSNKLGFTWVSSQAAFWKEFLNSKPPTARVYIENFIDDTPELLAQLCDRVADPRFAICLDIGHASCNSNIPLREWISVLGNRIGHVHLHNNDGISDKHWPLGQGILDCAAILRQLCADANAETYVLECDFRDSLKWLYENGFILKDMREPAQCTAKALVGQLAGN